VGIAVGNDDGEAEGFAVVGRRVGMEDGTKVGRMVGAGLGPTVLRADGLDVDGTGVGSAVGVAVGRIVGTVDGIAEGTSEGTVDGCSVGEYVTRDTPAPEIAA